MSKILGEISDSSFEKEVMSSDIPVVVDFWAPWCGPCKTIAPVLEELAQEYDGKIVIKKMNIDNNPVTPGKFQVRGIPNLVMIKNGEVIDQLVGAVEKSKIEQAIEKMLA